MSLWLPRPSPSLITRFPSNHRHPLARNATRLITASLRTPPHPHHPSHALLLVRRQSTNPTPDTSRSASTASSTASTQTTTTASEPKPPPAPKEVSAVKAPLSTRVWKKVKHEALHYWHGSKLLVSEVRISARLQWKILHGENLTRRERRQVCHDASSMLRYPPSVLTCFFIVAQAHNNRYSEAYSFRRLCRRTLHGIVTPSCPQVIPQHATLHFRGQVCCCGLFHLAPS